MTTPKQIKRLIERFQENRDVYCSSAYNEAQARHEFIDPFFKALGCDVNNEKGYAEAYKEVIHEDAIKVGGATKAPDGEKRFIEVKGRAESGPIVLTGAEVDKLCQLGLRAWLYIVTFCKSDQPRLRIIQDPISTLSPEMLCRQIQYLVAEDDWIRQGQEVSAGGNLP